MVPIAQEELSRRYEKSPSSAKVEKIFGRNNERARTIVLFLGLSGNGLGNLERAVLEHKDREVFRGGSTEGAGEGEIINRRRLGTKIPEQEALSNWHISDWKIEM